MHQVTLTGRIAHGPLLSFRDEKPEVGLFLRTITPELGPFGFVSCSLNSHHIRASGDLALELWAVSPGDRITVRGRLVWITYPCEAEDERTFVHVEAEQVEVVTDPAAPDLNTVELTVQLSDTPRAGALGLVHAMLTHRGASTSPVGSESHFLKLIAAGEAANELTARSVGEPITLAGHLWTDGLEACACKLLVQGVVVASGVRKASPDQIDTNGLLLEAEVLPFTVEPLAS